MKAGLVTLSCTGGSYIDEATGKTTNADDMRAAFIHSGRGDFTVSASPLSEIAYRLARTGAGLAADIAAKNKMVATKFGISDVNFVKTIPTELNDKRANNDNAGKFGLILAAVSQMMESDSSISINTLINYLTQDDEVLAYKLITAMNECSTGSAGADNGVACSGTGNLGAAFSATGEGSIKGNFAIALISFYDGTNTVPSIENYKDAGVTGVTIDNLAEVNAVVAKATPANSNTAAKIQTLVNSAAGEPSVAASTLSASPTTVITDGEAISTITLQAKDKDRKNIITGGLNVTMTTTGDAILSNSIDVGDGTYTATITNTKAESVTITASIAGEDVVSTVTVSFMPGEVSLITSTLTADPTTVIADG